MQYNRPPDRRPMSEGNKLLILILVLVIFSAGGLSIYLNRGQDAALTAGTGTAEPTQDTLPSMEDILGTATEAPSATPVILVTPEPEAVATDTPVPDFYMTPTPTEIPTLKLNSSGDEVRKLQARLIELGYMRDGADDGQFGKGTQNAVKAFQAANGLGADGAAGPKTLTLLYSDQAKAKPQ